MLLAAYQLEHNPFAAVGDGGELFLTPARRAILQQIGSRFAGRQACTFLVGAPGVGKRALTQHFLNGLDDNTVVARAGPEHNTPDEFFRALLDDLGLEAVNATAAELRGIAGLSAASGEPAACGFDPRQ